MFLRWYGFLVFVFVFNLTLHAENGKYVLGTSVSLTGGGTNFTGFSGLSVTQPFASFYGVYPTVTMGSNNVTGTVWSTSYSYGQERTNSEPRFKHESHAASMRFSSRLSPIWTISFSDSFDHTSDAATFNGLRGVTADPGSPFVFYPVAALIAARGNVASFDANYRFSDRSILSITISHFLRDYGKGGSEPTAIALANQQRFSGDMTYKYQTGPHEIWSFGYTGAYFDFAPYANLSHFGNAYSQSPHVGYANQLAPGLTFDLTAGISAIQSEGTAGNYIGYNSAANLRKTINNGSVGIYFRQVSADLSGLGSLSSTRSAGASYNYTARRRATLFVDASAFDTQGTLDNIYNVRGYAATASVGIPLARTWSLQVGGQFQRYEGLQAFAFTQTRVFLSLRYNNPSLKKF